MTPLVSILTATYNRPELLREAISSMLSQSFNEWEMLVLDDGSEPDVQFIVDGFADPRLCYFRLEHCGLPTARNRGLELARGDYIGFLDDDDLYHPDKLAREITFFQTRPGVEIVGSGYRIMDKAGTVLHECQPWHRSPSISGADILFGVPLIPCSVLIARRAIDQLDHGFDPAFDRGVGDDTDFFTRLFLTGTRFGWLKEILSDYRRLHERSGAVLLDSWRAYRLVYDKVFKSPDLSPDVAAQKHRVMINHQLNYAWAAYASGAEQAGQRFLLQALVLEPRLAGEQVNLLLESLAAFSGNKLFVDDPNWLIDFVLIHLPSPLSNLASRRQEIKKLAP